MHCLKYLRRWVISDSLHMNLKHRYTKFHFKIYHLTQTMLRIACLLALSQFTVAYDANGVPIPPDADGRLRVLVSLKGDIANSLGSVNAGNWETRGERGQAVEKLLQDHAEKSQKGLMEYLNTKDGSGRRLFDHSDVKSYWITNEVLIKGASEQMINELKKRDDVASVNVELEFPIEQPTEISADEISTNALQWGVQRVRANTAWNNYDGKGIVVGGIDTGVRRSHRILKDNYFGSYGWYDPQEKTKTPNDQGGHGTHTMGTILGSEGYGVAPGAKWMACKGCGKTSCSQSALLACGEFFVCPTDTNGNNKDCSKAPHVVNNSWGGGRGNRWYMQVVNAWHAAGIIPVFSAGNSGPNCNTANSPGDYPNVISVASTTSSNTISSFSSRGQTVDIAAPGSSVRSAYVSSDSSFATYSGTSMAAPHVSGVIALMLQKNDELEYDSVINIIQATASRSIRAQSQVCGGRSQRQFPNHAFGYGIIDAVNALSRVPEPCQWKKSVGCIPSNTCQFSWESWQCSRR